MATPYPLNIYHPDSLYPFESDLSPYFHSRDECSDVMGSEYNDGQCLQVMGDGRAQLLCQDLMTEFLESDHIQVSTLDRHGNTPSDTSLRIQTQSIRGACGPSPGVDPDTSFLPYNPSRKQSTESSKLFDKPDQRNADDDRLINALTLFKKE